MSRLLRCHIKSLSPRLPPPAAKHGAPRKDYKDLSLYGPRRTGIARVRPHGSPWQLLGRVWASGCITAAASSAAPPRPCFSCGCGGGGGGAKQD
eukprot:scaffold67842_cov63-Phaeocystis_antarctica.AAC.1